MRNWNSIRSARYVVAFFAVTGVGLLEAKRSAAEIRLTGVNLFGAEFGTAGANAALPGNYNQHYIYPTTAEINYYVGKGMNTFRLPFRWERLQQSANAALNATELNRMNTFVTTATNAGAHVILEPHNFARYYPNISDFNQMQSGTTGRVDTPTEIDAFADFWGKVADQYKGNDRVIFNLMNEPNAINQQIWVDSANAAIDAIRDTGAKNLILVPGTRWTGAWTWNDFDGNGASNAASMLSITDAADNFAFEVHQYFNSNGSGGDETIAGDDIDVGVDRISSFTDWLLIHGRKGFLGEFAVANSRVGGGPTQIGDELINSLLGYMEDNSDVWLGWTWWASGPWWTNYMFSPEPDNLSSPTPTDKPIMGLIQPHFANHLDGDFNFDGTVDALDYTVWRNAFGPSGAGHDADANFDGTVDETDFDVWKAHYGESLGPGAGGAASVPEPATIVILLLAGIGIAAGRSRSR